MHRKMPDVRVSGSSSTRTLTGLSHSRLQNLRWRAGEISSLTHGAIRQCPVHRGESGASPSKSNKEEVRPLPRDRRAGFAFVVRSARRALDIGGGGI